MAPSTCVKCIILLTGLAKHTVNELDVNICTHIIYSFAVLNPSTHEMVAYDSWLDINLHNYANFIDLKLKNPNVKLIIGESFLTIQIHT